mmetsp:Transcript_1916/g.2198  ORF Transcript_1916/g.2198 Transcript_1916/m.2198 type:complete len:960 (-) Transcript_1916:1304-4183(-)
MGTGNHLKTPKNLREGIKYLDKGAKRIKFPRSVKVRDYGASKIAEKLSQNSSCVSLDLRYNGIEDCGFYHLLDGLLHNKTLSHLMLGTNQINLAEEVTLTELKYDENNKLYSTYKSSYNLLDASEKTTEVDRALDREETQSISTQKSFSTLYKVGSGRSYGSDSDWGTGFDRDDDDASVFSHSSKKTVEGLERSSSRGIDERITQDLNIDLSGLSGLTSRKKKIVKQKFHQNEIVNLRSFMIRVLSRNKSLVYLDLSNNEIGDEGTAVIADVLSVNSGLLVLDLQLNKISPRGAKYIADSLLENNTLEVLKLDMTKISDEGLGYICEALEKNSTLSTLSLKNNSIGDDGAKFLAEVLTKNSALSKVILQNNSIGFSGVMSLFNSVSKSSLRSLDLSKNSFGTDAFAFIIKSLVENETLESLNLSSVNANMEKPSVLEAMLTFMKSNRTLKYLSAMNNIGSCFEVDSILVKIENRSDPLISYPEHDDASNIAWTTSAWKRAKRQNGVLATLVALEEMKENGFVDQLVELLLQTDKSGLTILDLCLKQRRGTCLIDLFKFVYDNGFNLFLHMDSQERPYIDALREVGNEELSVWVDSLQPIDVRSQSMSSSVISLEDYDDGVDPSIRHKLFSNRFKRLPGPLIYESVTSMVLYAEDRLLPAKKDGSYPKAVVKIMLDRESYQSEKRGRNFLELHGGTEVSSYILPAEFPDQEVEEIDDPGKYLVMNEYGETLGDFLFQSNIAGRKIRKIQEVSYKIACALHFVNSKALVHGDICPSNVVTVEGKNGFKTWKLTDFASSCMHGTPYSGPGKMSAYSPPEYARHLFGEQKRRESVYRDMPEKPIPAQESIDVWGFGVLLFELLTGTSLFGKDHSFLLSTIYTREVISKLTNWDGYIGDKLLNKILAKATVNENPDLTLGEIKHNVELAKDLIFICLNGDPLKRVTFEKIIEHEFFEQQAELIY